MFVQPYSVGCAAEEYNQRCTSKQKVCIRSLHDIPVCDLDNVEVARLYNGSVVGGGLLLPSFTPEMAARSTAMPAPGSRPSVAVPLYGDSGDRE